MKLTEVIDDAHLIAALINGLIRKNVDVLVVAFDDYMDTYVDAYILKASVSVIENGYLDLDVAIQDDRNGDSFRCENLEVLADNYTLEKDPHDQGAWRLAKVSNEAQRS